MSKELSIDYLKSDKLKFIFFGLLLGFIIAYSAVSKDRYAVSVLALIISPIFLLMPLKFTIALFIGFSFAFQSDFAWNVMEFGGTQIRTQEMLVMLSFLLLGIDILKGTKKIRLTPLSKAFIPFLLYYFVALYIGLNNNNVASFMNIDTRSFLSYSVVFPLTYFFQKDEDAVLFYKIILIAFGVFIFTTLSPLFFGNILPVAIRDRGRVWIRNVVIMPFSITLMLQMLFFTDKKREKIIILVLIPIALLVLLISQTRVAWVGMAIMLCLFLIVNYFKVIEPQKRSYYLKRFFQYLAIGFVLLILTIFFFLKDEFGEVWELRFITFKYLKYDPSLWARRLGGHESKYLIAQSPWFGLGLGAEWNTMGKPMNSTDNYYWMALVKLGIIGTIIMLLGYMVWCYELLYLFTRWKQIENKYQKALIITITLFFPTIFIMMIVTMHLFAPSIIISYLSLAAFTDFTYCRLKQKKDKD